MSREKWSKDQIIIKLKELKTSGSQINPAFLMKYHSKLFSAITRHFISWDSAVKAAGFDPKVECFKKHVNTDEELIAFLKGMKDKGQSISPSAILKIDKAKYRALQRNFGSWEKAIELVGLVPSEERVNKKWSTEKIKNEILSLYTAGEKLNSKNCQIKHSRLWRIAWNYFGSWEKAIEAAGLDSALARLTPVGFSPSHKLGRHPLSPSIEDEARIIKEGHLPILFQAIRKLRKQIASPPNDKLLSEYLQVEISTIEIWQRYRHELIRLYMPLAKSLALKFYYSNIDNCFIKNAEKEDFISSANLTLVDSIERFDWTDPNGSFSRYLKKVLEKQLLKSVPDRDAPFTISLHSVVHEGKDGTQMLLIEKVESPNLQETAPEYLLEREVLRSLIKRLPSNMKEIAKWDLGLEDKEVDEVSMAFGLDVTIDYFQYLTNATRRRLLTLAQNHDLSGVTL